MTIEQLFEFHESAKARAEQYALKRSLYDRILQESGKHFTGIVGPRGSGKTVLLWQYAASHQDAFYLSTDVLSGEDDLLDIVKMLQEHYGFNTLLLDEIHFMPEPAQTLKKLYDFRDVKVIFTSSVALAMRQSAYDLSRRVKLLTLFPFSFREYLRFKEGVYLDKLSLEQIINRQWDPQHLRTGRHFDKYLKGGILPFSMHEPDPLPLLRGIIDKVVSRDIPSVEKLMTGELPLIRKLLQFVGTSAVDGINYSSLSRNLGITKYKAEQYIHCLEKAFVLHRVFPGGTNVLREPKVLMAPPCRLLYRDYKEAVGGLREDFCVESLKQAEMELRYLKSTRGAKTPDFLIVDRDRKLVVEVGGKGKGREQFKGIKADRKIVFAHQPVPDEKRLPLFLLGHLA